MTTPDWINLRGGVVVGVNGPCAKNGHYVRVGELPSEGVDDRQWCETHGMQHSMELRDPDCEFPEGDKP